MYYFIAHEHFHFLLTRFNTGHFKKCQTKKEIFRIFTRYSPLSLKAGNKKATNLFQTYCSCSAVGRCYSVVNSSTVKPKLEKALYQLGFDVVLHIHVIVSVDSGEVLDISGIPGKDSVYSCRVALLRLHYRFKGEKSVAHSLTPPFPHIAAAGRCGYAARCCSAFSRNFPQFPFVSAHKNNRDISFPA